MDIGRIRISFENHIDKFYPHLSIEIKRSGFMTHSNEQRKDLGNEYVDHGVQLIWEMFLAGAIAQQKNMQVQLPPIKDEPDSFYDIGYNEGVKECRKNLISNGISVSN